ncbi:MAG: hypothetical protein EBZ13_10575 [Planctomycetia bacterium]|nr:hypothetical protein [Planctomycetia bacterium]
MASRRNFLARSTAFGAALLGCSSGIRAAANERLTLGFIGLGERGIYLLNQFLAEPDIEIVAVCDPYELHYREREWGKGKALGRRPARDLIAKAAGRPPAYDLWCGPAEQLPYMQARHHRWWRGHTAFGGGVLMDWIGHHNDIAHWSLDLDTSGPERVESTIWTPAKTAVYDTPWHYTIQCNYPSGPQSTISDTHQVGTKWTGPDGWIHVTRGRLTASDNRWLVDDFSAGPFSLGPATGHVRNFLDGVKTRQTCVAPANVGHRSITPGHLGYVSQAVGRPLTWDPVAQQISNDPEAQQLLERNHYRAPWQLPG